MDKYKSLVYQAEDELAHILQTGGTIDHFGSVFTVPAERKFSTVADIGPYLKKVLAYAPIAALDGANVPVNVRVRKGGTKAHYEHRTHTIAIPDRTTSGWALRETVVLHELAHHLCEAGAGHNQSFTATLVYLYHHVIAPEAAHMLKIALWERQVPIATTPHTKETAA